MVNTIQLWLEIIATRQNAEKLRLRVDGLKSPKLDPLFGPEPPLCPTVILYGSEKSNRLYCDPKYRPALDAWDQGFVTPSDIRRYCQYLESIS